MPNASLQSVILVTGMVSGFEILIFWFNSMFVDVESANWLIQLYITIIDRAETELFKRIIFPFHLQTKL